MTIVVLDASHRTVASKKVVAATLLRIKIRELRATGYYLKDIASICHTSTSVVGFVVHKEERRLTLDRLYVMSLRLGISI